MTLNGAHPSWRSKSCHGTRTKRVGRRARGRTTARAPATATSLSSVMLFALAQRHKGHADGQTRHNVSPLLH